MTDNPKGAEMEQLVVVHRIIAEQAYVAGRDEDDYWWEGEPATVEVNRQEGKVRIGLLTDVGLSEDAGIYLSDSEAMKLMAAIGASIHV